MRRRIEAVVSVLQGVHFAPAHALRQTLAEGYGLTDLRRDILAGIVVGIIALPLSMALAIASGVPPQHGLYTAIIAGGICALLGGSRVQVSGPTAAFVVILAPISAKFGLAGLLVATALAGLMLIVMGLLRFGQLIQFIPYPVTTGFTAGIAVVIATLQLKDFLGLDVPVMPEHYIEKVTALATALPTMRWADFGIGVGSLAILLLWPRYVKRIPAALIALPLAAVVGVILVHLIPGLEVQTIQTRFGGVPQAPPIPGWPWSFHAPGDQPLVLSWGMVRELLPAAFAIAMLGAIESLLSAVVSDGMTGRTHEPNAELLAQGVGNVVAPFFGGFAATGAIARTAANVRAGGRSPIAAFVHALFVLASVLLLSPLLGYLPMAALAALLLVVAKNMCELRHFLYVLRVAPKGDVTVLLACFGLTVIFDMVIAVSVGIVLAAVLFMRRMAEVSGVQLIGETHPHLTEPLPTGVLLYEINGPLFFGAAQKAMSALHEIGSGVRVVVLDVESVPVIDATGLANLESTILRLHRDNIFVILGGVQPQPLEVLTKARLEDEDSRIGICATLDEALMMARFHLALGEDLHSPVHTTHSADVR